MGQGAELFRTGGMEEDELRLFVWQQLGNYSNLDADRIYVQVENGVVRLIGRVGEAAEREIAEHILTDVLDLQNIDNQLIVDPIVRMDTARSHAMEDDDFEADEEDWVGILNSRALDSSEARSVDEDWGLENGQGPDSDEEDHDMDLPYAPTAI